MPKNGEFQIEKGGCPMCGGDLYIGYKHGGRYKCIQGSHYFAPLNKDDFKRAQERDRLGLGRDKTRW